MSENTYNQAAHSGAVNIMDYVDKIEKFLESLLDKFNRWQADTYKDILLSDIFGIEKSELKDYSLQKVNGISEDSLNALCQQYGISDYIISRDIDGQMYFAGRKDFQIKHMGHRIELEEIERGINAHDRVDRSCCSYDAKRSRIYAYYTGSVDKKELHGALKEKLPLYMVPNRFVHVRSFVLNKNGKIDETDALNILKAVVELVTLPIA